MDLDKLISTLNSAKIVQTKALWLEDFSYWSFEKYLVDFELVAENINVEKHTFYELSTSVYANKEGRYVGVRLVTAMNKSVCAYSDIDHVYEFFEMEPIQVTSYRKLSKS